MFGQSSHYPNQCWIIAFTELTSDSIEVIFFEGNAVNNGWGLSVDSEFIHDNGTRVEKNSHSDIG